MVIADLLRLNHVEVRLREKTVLYDLDFQVNEGEFIGVIGPNGAGKTTLLKMILGLIPIAKGQVLFGGQELRRGNRQLAYVPQKIQFDHDVPLRARDLVGFGYDGHRFGFRFSGKERRKAVDEVLEAVNARHFAEAPVGQLSGGEQQRLLIAQALLNDPKLLLLDEPLANLDIRSVNEVVDLLGSICRQRRIAIMLVAHDVNPLLDEMDQVIYVASGRAIKGQPDSVIQKETLSALYGYEVDVLRLHGRIFVVAGKEGMQSEFPKYISK